MRFHQAFCLQPLNLPDIDEDLLNNTLIVYVKKQLPIRNNVSITLDSTSTTSGGKKGGSSLKQVNPPNLVQKQALATRGAAFNDRR